MSDLQLFLTIVGMGLVTFAIRLSFIILAGRIRLPDTVRRGLTYVPTAVLSAIILPDMLIRDNQLNLTLENEYLFAGLVAIVAAWFSKNVIVTIVVGLLVIWVWPLLVG